MADMHNIVTRQVAALSASYTEIFGAKTATYGLGVFHPSEDMWLAMGVATPNTNNSDAIWVPAGTGFSIAVGIQGAVHVRCAVANATISVYGS